MTRSFFLSYSSDDVAAVEALEAALLREGVEVWRDRRGLYAGDRWPKRLGDEVAARDALILVWSERAAESRFVELEWCTALALGKPVLPYVLDEAPLPAALASLHNLSASRPEEDAARLSSFFGRSERATGTMSEAGEVLDALAGIEPGETATLIEAARTALATRLGPLGARTAPPPTPSERVDASVTPGARLGPYEIVNRLGAGGMGEVWRGVDTRLDREVAVKILPEGFAGRDDMRLRFEREARTISRLNHPHICTLHDLGRVDRAGETEPLHYLVMELIEGESLAERLERGALPLEEVVVLGRQVAEALAAAHAQGVVHRDLKPGNVMLTKAGAKLLDFGLAKEGAPDSGVSTRSATTADAPRPLTEEGTILGTFQYMSPEQLEGVGVDHRSDIFALGAVLYEMATGRRAFRAESRTSLIAAIVAGRPEPISAAINGVPLSLEHVIERCLEKEPDARWQSARDVAGELEWIRRTGGVRAAPPEGPPASRFRRPTLGLALVLALALGAVAAWWSKPPPAPAPRPVVHTEVNLPGEMRVYHLHHGGLAISPDGGLVAFFAGEGFDDEENLVPAGLRLRYLDQPSVVPVPGTSDLGYISSLAFSPDGRWLAFNAKDGIFRVELPHGEPIRVVPDLYVRGLAWTETNVLVAARPEGLVQFPAEGGAPRQITELDREAEEILHEFPHVLPGRGSVLFTVLRFGPFLTAPGAWSVWAADLGSGERRLVVEHASDARFVRGRIVFAREGSLWAAPFDPVEMELTGEPRRVVDGVQHSIYGRSTSLESGTACYAVSESGTLVYGAGSVTPEIGYEVVAVDRSGKETVLEVDKSQWGGTRGSEDGRWLLSALTYPLKSSVWLHDLERGIARRQRKDGTGSYALWGPGPNRITYDRTSATGRRGLYSKTIGGESSEEREIDLPENGTILPSEWSPDGRVLLGVSVDADLNFDLWAYRAGEGWSPLNPTATADEGWPTLSPDGSLLAYASEESGTWQVLVRPFPDRGRTVQVSRHGGVLPLWSRDGAELFYRGTTEEGERAVFAVGLSRSDGEIRAGRPERLFADAFLRRNPIRGWDLLGSDLFVFRRDPSGEERRKIWNEIYPDRLQLVQNWADSLE